jgi:hypothetical protein
MKTGLEAAFFYVLSYQGTARGITGENAVLKKCCTEQTNRQDMEHSHWSYRAKLSFNVQSRLGHANVRI